MISLIVLIVAIFRPLFVLITIGYGFENIINIIIFLVIHYFETKKEKLFFEVMKTLMIKCCR